MVQLSHYAVPFFSFTKRNLWIFKNKKPETTNQIREFGAMLERFGLPVWEWLWILLKEMEIEDNTYNF